MTISERYRRIWTRWVGGVPYSGSPGDHAPARFPSEPPSLACPTPPGRARVAERGGASPWWTGARLWLERTCPWLFEPVPGDQIHQYMPEYSPPQHRTGTASDPHRLRGAPVAEPVRPTKAVAEFAPVPPSQAVRSKSPVVVGSRTPLITQPDDVEGSYHASAPRLVPVGSHDAAIASGIGDAAAPEVANHGIGAGTLFRSNGATARAGTRPAPAGELSILAPSGARPRHRHGAACDIRALLRDDHAAVARKRAHSGPVARPATVPERDRRRREMPEHRQQPDRTSLGDHVVRPEDGNLRGFR